MRNEGTIYVAMARDFIASMLVMEGLITAG
jgi:hypothetical protein